MPRRVRNRKFVGICATLSAVFCAGALAAGPAAVGQFDEQADVGKVDHPGFAAFDAQKKEYRVTGSGANIWENADAFHFVWNQLSGDVSITARIEFAGQGGNKHRKACLMIRQGLEADAAYADVAVHGDGLVSLQFRKKAGEVTAEVQSPLRSPAAVRLERKGDTFTLAVSRDGKAFEKVGSATIVLSGAVYVGLAVSSHDAAVSETAVFSDVALK